VIEKHAMERNLSQEMVGKHAETTLPNRHVHKPHPPPDPGYTEERPHIHSPEEQTDERTLSQSTTGGHLRISLSFVAYAGAKLIVTLLGGTMKPLFWIAATTRSFPSFTAPCGSPTVEKEGRPLATSASTVTMYASIPRTAPERARASTGREPEAGRRGR